MFNVSDNFKSYSALANREFECKLLINSVEYTGDFVKSFDIDESIASGDELSIGSVAATKLTVVIRANSSLVVSSNAKIEPFIRLKSGVNVTEWMPVCTYYVDNRKFLNNTWTFECYDSLMLTNQTYVSTLTYPANMTDVFDEIIGILGLVADSSVVINPAYIVNINNEDMTMHDKLSYIAISHGANVYLAKDNKVHFAKLGASIYNESIGTHEYTKARVTNSPKTFTKIICTYNDDNDVYESGTGSPAETMLVYNPYADQAMVDSILSGITGTTYTPMSIDWRGRPYLDVGDSVTIPLIEGGSFTSILLRNSISFKGGYFVNSEAPAKSEQKSEFNFSGNLTSTIKRSLSGVVKQDVTYYGVAIGKLYGIKIDSTTGGSAVLNSDKLEFTDDNGTPRLFFDIPSKKYIFDGLLSASAIEAMTLNANKGYVAELTVDSIDTSIKIQRYKDSNTDVVEYWRGYGNRIEFITAFALEPTSTIQARSRDDELLYWADETREAVTLQPNTYPVMQYEYLDKVTLAIQHFIDEATGYTYPKITFGAGFGLADPDIGKGFIYKDSDEFVLEYKKAGGEYVGFRFNDTELTQFGNTGTDGVRNTFVSDTAPVDPQNNDLWIDTSV